MSKIVDNDIYLRVEGVNEFDIDRVNNFCMLKFFKEIKTCYFFYKD